MAEPNRIATGAFVNQLAGTSLEADRCIIRTLIEATGKATVAGSYALNQLVKETDVSKIGLFINNQVVLVNFGTTLINNIIIVFGNTSTGASASVSTGGGFANGSSRTVALPNSIYGTGSGNLVVDSVTINGTSLGISTIPSKINLRTKSSSSNLPQPTTWGTLSLGAYMFVNSTAKPPTHMQVDIKWP